MNIMPIIDQKVQSEKGYPRPQQSLNQPKKVSTAMMRLQWDNNHVRPLFNHIFSIADPTLAFIGLPWKVVPFPLMELQARYVARIFAGSIALPSQEVMLDENLRNSDFSPNVGHSPTLATPAPPLGIFFMFCLYACYSDVCMNGSLMNVEIFFNSNSH